MPVTAILMANDNVALVVSVNPNERPRGGPSGNSTSPFINNHNAINNNTPSRANDDSREVDETDVKFHSVESSIRPSGSSNRTNHSNDNGGLISVKNISPSSGSCSSVKTSPHHKLIAK